MLFTTPSLSPSPSRSSCSNYRNGVVSTWLVCVCRGRSPAPAFQNSTQWGAVTKGVLVCGGMHRLCMSASPPSQLIVWNWCIMGWAWCGYCCRITTLFSVLLFVFMDWYIPDGTIYVGGSSGALPTTPMCRHAPHRSDSRFVMRNDTAGRLVIRGASIPAAPSYVAATFSERIIICCPRHGGTSCVLPIIVHWFGP